MLSITADCLRSRRHDVPRSEVSPLIRLADSPKTGPLPRSVHAGFTLVELLTVIAIIGILSAITFGVVKGVNERAAIGQAKAELGTIAQALESYKRQYGDYPQTDDSAEMLQSLIGRLGPKGDPISPAGKIFLDFSQFSLSSPTESPFDDDSITLIDPWGRTYIYKYKTSINWKNPTYVLLSAGADGKTYGNTNAPDIGALLNNNGTLKSDAPDNKGAADNIYSNK